MSIPMKMRLLAATILSAAAIAPAGFSQTADEDADLRLEDIIVVDSGSQVDLTEPYAGGQVARGGRTGLLGNLDFLDSPFSGTAYTEELVRNQQADSIGDALQNDPVVRVAKGFGNFQEVYVVRGFPVYSDDMMLNGLYGILPRQFVAAEIVERVEVFRGANAFLNGAAPGGSGVGGAFNLVPKRAPEGGLNRATVGYENPGQFSGALDVARRLGSDDEYGWRFNAVRRDGEGSIDDQSRELSVLSLGTDYAGDRFRASFDIGYQDNQIDAPRPQVTPVGGVPEVPHADVNYAQPWTYSNEEQLFGVVRGEYDVTDFVTIWAAAGARNGEEANVLANPSATLDGTTSAYRFDNTREDDVVSADAGLRTEFETGPVGHRLIVSGSTVKLESANAYAFSNFAGFAGDLYSPSPVAPPTPDFFIGGVLSDPLKTEESETSSLAVADMMSFLNGKVLATIGLRQQWIETKTFDYNSGAELSSYDDSALTPSFGLVYQPTSTFSVYGNYSESLQPGATAPATSGGTPILNAGEVLEPFRSDQVEVGVKYDSGVLAGTLAAFTLSKPSAIVENQIYSASGEQDVMGIEGSIFGEPTSGLRLIGGFTWLDAELANTEGGLNEGNTPIGIPEWQANANVEWDIPTVDGLTVEGRMVFTGEQYIDAANTTELDSWTRFDLGARLVVPLETNELTFRARVENIADEAYWASTGGFPGANYLVQGNPRTFMLSASVDF
tara:strand:+ start:19041 stop:21221 length:2181 start_codon:yes stop_codon:yes gene_type:complete